MGQKHALKSMMTVARELGLDSEKPEYQRALVELIEAFTPNRDDEDPDEKRGRIHDELFGARVYAVTVSGDTDPIYVEATSADQASLIAYRRTGKYVTSSPLAWPKDGVPEGIEIIKLRIKDGVAPMFEPEVIGYTGNFTASFIESDTEEPVGIDVSAGWSTIDEGVKLLMISTKAWTGAIRIELDDSVIYATNDKSTRL